VAGGLTESRGLMGRNDSRFVQRYMIGGQR